MLPRGKQTMFANRVQWTKAYLLKAGLVESNRCGHSGSPIVVRISTTNTWRDLRSSRHSRNGSRSLTLH